MLCTGFKLGFRQMIQFRFKVPGDDGRPMDFPPEGPFWTTGYGDDYAIVVAFSPNESVLTQNDRWPDAYDIDDGGEQPIEFSVRFPKPIWWDEENTIV
jgi:hypothetical protein